MMGDPEIEAGRKLAWCALSTGDLGSLMVGESKLEEDWVLGSLMLIPMRGESDLEERRETRRNRDTGRISGDIEDSGIFGILL